MKNLYELLSKWLTWQKTGVILIGLGLVFGIASFMLPFFQAEKELAGNMNSKAYREEMDRYILKIRKEIRPEDIPSKLDTFFDVKLVKQFQKGVQDFSSYCESMENESMNELGSRIKDYTFAYYHYLTKKAVMIQKQNDVDSIMVLLVNYGNENGIDYNVNEAEVTMVRKLAQEHFKLIHDAKEVVTIRNLETNKKYNVEKIDEDNDTMMMYKVYDEYNKNFLYLDSIKLHPSYYGFYSYYFRFLLNMNEKYMLRIKEYESKVY